MTSSEFDLDKENPVVNDGKREARKSQPMAKAAALNQCGDAKKRTAIATLRDALNAIQPKTFADSCSTRRRALAAERKSSVEWQGLPSNLGVSGLAA